MKNLNQKEKIAIFAVLFLSVILFFAFGFYHLTKFETTDEHLWKYGRIKQYWQALKNKEWEKTYINDKPGITVALISGSGLLFEPNPENHKITDPAITANGLFEVYDTQKTERINFVFRFPILIFSTLSLLIFFWLTLRSFSSPWLALFATIFISTNPILIGMSQIINPDSFLWIFGGLAAFSYLAFINTRENKFLLLCGLFTGMALLSKYTAFILFIFYALALFAKIIFLNREDSSAINQAYLFKQTGSILKILLIAIAVFSFFLPAVFSNPNYIIKGISQFLSVPNIIALLLVIGAVGFLTVRRNNLINDLIDWLAKKSSVFVKIVCVMFVLLILTSFVNVWTEQKISPVDALRDNAYANEPKEFNFKPLLVEENFLQKNIQLFLMEIYPFIFSISPVLIFLLLFILIKSFFGKISANSKPLIFLMISFFLIYFASTIFAQIITNARYLILLYPLLALLGAFTLIEFFQHLRIKSTRSFLFFSILIISCGALTLWHIRPFYFSYASSLLPGKFSIHDSWGHGFYEAAQHLNSLPNSTEHIIRSNSGTICPFLNGKCLKSRKIDINVARPDYFVTSKRGVLKERNHFIFINSTPIKDSRYYYAKMQTE